MIVKLDLSFPCVFIRTKTVELQLNQSMSKNEIIDWVFANKKEILKNNGCELTETELASAIALGMANVKVFVDK